MARDLLLSRPWLAAAGTKFARRVEQRRHERHRRQTEDVPVAGQRFRQGDYERVRLARTRRARPRPPR